MDDESRSSAGGLLRCLQALAEETATLGLLRTAMALHEAVATCRRETGMAAQLTVAQAGANLVH